MVTFPITLSDLNVTWCGFQGHNIFGSWMSQKRCILRTKLLQNINRKRYLTYRMVPCLFGDLDWSVAQLCQRKLSFLLMVANEMWIVLRVVSIGSKCSWAQRQWHCINKFYVYSLLGFRYQTCPRDIIHVWLVSAKAVRQFQYEHET